jgi:hypothetical protein
MEFIEWKPAPKRLRVIELWRDRDYILLDDELYIIYPMASMSSYFYWGTGEELWELEEIKSSIVEVGDFWDPVRKSMTYKYILIDYSKYR